MSEGTVHNSSFTIHNLVVSPWLVWLELVLAVLAGAFWFFWPGAAGWEPLLLLALPWGLRAAAGEFPFKRTPFSGWLLLFMATAVLGIVTAYDRAAALEKFWVLVGAVLIFQALVRVGKKDLAWAVWVCLVPALGAAAAFLLTHDWRAWPADVALVTRLGVGWMGIRPFSGRPFLHPNMVGGVAALFTPLLLAALAGFWRRRRWGWMGGTAAALVFLLLCLILTSSRAAWLSLAAGLGVWGLWRLMVWVKKRRGWSGTAVFAGLVLLALAGGLIFVWTVGGPAVMARLSGSVTSASRLGLAADALRLIRDVPFTGSGLRSFGGWYSQYILVIPNFMFSYAHNFYLDVALEQGLPGLLALLVVLGGTAWRLLTTPLAADADSGWWRGALLASLVAALGHGLMDDALYGDLGTPFLWLLPGLVLVWQGERAWGRVRMGRGTAVFAAAVLLLAALFWRPVRAEWPANRAAVGMARVELAGWPRDEWDDGRSLAELEPVQAQLAAALALDPANGTALYRAGLLAMLGRDYETAVFYLERANEQRPGHRGVQKNLGYSYLWLGDVEKAALLLADFPEVGRELEAYVDWWEGNGRVDLARRAEQGIEVEE